VPQECLARSNQEENAETRDSEGEKRSTIFVGSKGDVKRCQRRHDPEEDNAELSGADGIPGSISRSREVLPEFRLDEGPHCNAPKAPKLGGYKERVVNGEIHARRLARRPQDEVRES
jgi:hypothetical protein